MKTLGLLFSGLLALSLLVSAGETDFDGFVCGMHIGGNWGTTRDEIGRPSEEYFAYLERVRAKWVGISVSMTVEGSMDASVETCGDEEETPTFDEQDLRQFIRTLRTRGFHVYVALAFDNMGDGAAGNQVKRWELGDPNAYIPNDGLDKEFWPWHPDHPEHETFVAAFFESYTDLAVRYAQLCQEEGVEIYSLGTETDRLFRTRTHGTMWPTEFRAELMEMVQRVKTVFSGAVTYDMLSFSLTEPFPEGLHALWHDVGLDAIGLSAYFRPLLDCVPDGPPASTEQLLTAWRAIFQRYLVPLSEEHPELPLLFTEFGFVDSVGSSCNEAHMQFVSRIFRDSNANGLDDGQEEQASAYEAFFMAVQEFPEIVDGVFCWGDMVASDRTWESSFGTMRCFSVRDKLAEQVVGDAFASLSEQDPGSE